MCTNADRLKIQGPKLIIEKFFLLFHCALRDFFGTLSAGGGPDKNCVFPCTNASLFGIALFPTMAKKLMKGGKGKLNKHFFFFLLCFLIFFVVGKLFVKYARLKYVYCAKDTQFEQRSKTQKAARQFNNRKMKHISYRIFFPSARPEKSRSHTTLRRKLP